MSRRDSSGADGLADIGEDAAYRLLLAAELIDAGVAPRELARELGFDSTIKYDRRSRACRPEAAGLPASGRRLGMPRGRR
jgi:hypothetical protein